MFLFGVIQIVMSQIPDFHSMMWVSVVAAVMSFCYSSIGFGLGVAKVVGNYAFINSNSCNRVTFDNFNMCLVN